VTSGPSPARLRARQHLQRGARRATQPATVAPAGPDLFTECGTLPCDDHDTTGLTSNDDT
jgi:hypothetical protein